MSRAKKVLGQCDFVTVGAVTPNDIYTVPNDVPRQSVLSNIHFANRTAGVVKVRVWIRPAGAAAILKHVIAYDMSIPANDVLALQLGITIASTDKVTVQSDTTGVSCSVFGYEETL